MISCLYRTVQLPGASLASAEVSLTLLEKDRYTDRYTAVFVELLPQLNRATIKINKGDLTPSPTWDDAILRFM